jgi:hypothetical protein
VNGVVEGLIWDKGHIGVDLIDMNRGCAGSTNEKSGAEDMLYCGMTMACESGSAEEKILRVNPFHDPFCYPRPGKYPSTPPLPHLYRCVRPWKPAIPALRSAHSSHLITSSYVNPLVLGEIA